MDDNASVSRTKHRPITVVAGGCLILLYLAFCVVAMGLSYTQIAARNAPSPTSTLTPAPHILVHAPSGQTKADHEDFSSNKNDWGLYFHYGKLEVIDGKLILQSNFPRGIALGTTSHFSPASENYYIQADFSTDVDAISSYGLAFGLNRSLSTYYLFEIWPRTGSFRLFKYNAGKWTELIPFSRIEMNPYPGSNTLSVYFDKGKMELYINGKSVSKYSDTDYFQSKDIGVFVNNSGYRLIVDDFFVYDKK